MRIGIGKKIGSVYVGVSKSFGGKGKGGGGCLGAIAVLFALPFILIYGFVVAVIALVKKIAEWTKEWDIKHKIILWVSIGGGFVVLVVIGCIVSPPQSGGNDNNIASKSTTTSALAASPRAYDSDDLWITEAETTSVHTTTTAIVMSEPEEKEEEEEETEPAIAETDTSEYEESNAENEEAQEDSGDEDTEDEVTVYITNTGKCYHYDSHCGNGDYFETSLDSALGMGLKPCKKCVE